MSHRGPYPARSEAAAGSGGRVLRWAVLGLTLPLAVIAGYYTVRHPELLHLNIAATPMALAGAVAAAVVAVSGIRFPSFALVLVVGALYLNLSNVLVRYHGMPSVLQMLALPVLLSAMLAHPPRDLVRIAGQPLTWLLAGYVLVQLLSTTYAANVGLADARVEESAKALVLYLLVLLLAASPGRLRLAGWAALLAGALLAVLGIFQVATGAFDNDFGGLARVKRAQIYGRVFDQRIAGPLGDPNFFAQILVPLVPIGLSIAWIEPRLRRRIAAFAATGGVLVASLLTYSRGGALVLSVVLLFSFVAHGTSWRRILLGGLTLLIAAMLFAPSGLGRRLTTIRQLLFREELLDMDSSFEKRLLWMRTAGEMFLENPVLGVGAANYPVRYGEYVGRLASTARDYEDPDAVRYPHNLYLEIGAETGLLGLSLFAAVLAVAFLSLGRARRARLRAGDAYGAGFARSVQLALAAYLVSSLFLHGHFQRYLWLLFALAAAASAVEKHPEREPEGARDAAIPI